MKNIYTLLVAIFLMCHLKLHAQDPVYSQYWIDKLYLNPASCGSDKGFNIASSMRWQWPSIISAFNTRSVSADFYAPNIGGGLGIQFLNDEAGEGFQKTNAANLFYSVKVPVGRIADLAVGFGGGYLSRTLDYSKLVFSDQLDPVNGMIYSTAAPLNNFSADAFNYSSGILFRTYFSRKENTRIKLGASISNVNEPNLSMFQDLNGEAKLSRRLNLHFDITIPVINASTSERYSIQPSLLFCTQKNDFHLTNAGVRLNILQLNAGFFYRSENFKNANRRDAMIFLFGYRLGNNNTIWEINYSYDYTVSNLTANTGGSHEIGISIFLRDKKLFSRNLNAMGRKQTKCPDFNKGYMPQVF